MQTFKPSKQFSHVLAIVALCSALTACGGGSLDSETDNPEPAVLVSVGPDVQVNEGVTYNLRGDATGQTAELTYQWSSSPLVTINHPDTSVSDATFDTPVTTEPLSYTFTLQVTDGNGNIGSDSVNIEVVPVNELPIAIINVVKPSDNQDGVFPAGVEMTLDSTGSIDVDAANPDEPIVAWRWQQTAGTNVLNNVSLDGDSIAFMTPIENEDSVISITLTVTDREGGEGTTSIDLNILSASNTVPSVNAGVDHTVFSGENIILNGTASSTIPAAAPLRFQWLNDSELQPVIDDDVEMQTFAIAPAVASEQLVTFSLEVTDSFGNQVDDSVTVRIKPYPLNVLNDTGILLQADETSVSANHVGDFPGQDGQRGPDIIHQNGQSEKAGRGQTGFDFTRLDDLGDEVDDITLPWSCVRDNITGLVWEVKSSDLTLHGARHSYAWYQTAQNGGDDGAQNSAAASCSITDCNTTAYAIAVNNVGLCNFNDWRVPTHAELLTLVHYGKTSGSKIDTEYFPNTGRGIPTPFWYWTNVPSVDGTSNNARNAWAIDFATGNDNFLQKPTAARVRLVRGGR